MAEMNAHNLATFCEKVSAIHRNYSLGTRHSDRFVEICTKNIDYLERELIKYINLRNDFPALQDCLGKDMHGNTSLKWPVITELYNQWSATRLDIDD